MGFVKISNYYYTKLSISHLLFLLFFLYLTFSFIANWFFLAFNVENRKGVDFYFDSQITMIFEWVIDLVVDPCEFMKFQFSRIKIVHSLFSTPNLYIYFPQICGFNYINYHLIFLFCFYRYIFELPDNIVSFMKDSCACRRNRCGFITWMMLRLWMWH